MNTRKLKIIKLDEKRRGEGKFGEWIMHEVVAEDENGKKIDQEIITFKGDKLPTNELIEVEVEKKEHEQYGTSFNISPLNPNKPPTREEFKRLAERVSDVEDRLEGSEAGSNKSKPQDGGEEPTQKEGPEKPSEDDLSDIPF